MPPWNVTGVNIEIPTAGPGPSRKGDEDRRLLAVPAGCERHPRTSAAGSAAERLELGVRQDPKPQGTHVALSFLVIQGDK